MENFTEAVNNPNRSVEMKRIHWWVDKFICAVMPRQLVVGNRKDEAGNEVTQEMADNKDRPAHVCPFVRDSIDRDLFWIEESHLGVQDGAAIEQLLREQMNDFINYPPPYDPVTTGQGAPMPVLSKTFLTFFPRIKHHSRGRLPLMDDMHSSLKPDFMQAGLMVGQFYAGCPEPAVYTAQTPKPWTDILNSPYPAFAIRYMAWHDHLFIKPGGLGYLQYKQFFP